MRTLIIDNYDSFTWNLYQLVSEVNGEPAVVVRNDEASWDALAGMGFENVVISPGPGRPERAGDFGVCREAIVRAQVPVLGVCLGHQGVAQAYGGGIVGAPEPMHGRTSRVHHDGSALFRGLPRPFVAVRYHSLMVESPLPEALVRTAWTDDGVIMGLRHRERPIWGVQFHPESILAEGGMVLLRNYRDLTWEHGRGRVSSRRASASVPAGSAAIEAVEAPRYVLRTRRIARAIDPERAFVHLYGDESHAFWLDSSLVRPGLSRFSFMGGGDGPHAQRVEHDARTRTVTVTQRGETTQRTQGLLEYLDEALAERRCACPELPFDFQGGFVGYLGYELRAELGHEVRCPSSWPDARLLLADRMLAFDHEAEAAVLLCLVPVGEEADAEAWLEATVARLEALPELAPIDAIATNPAAREGPVRFRLARAREAYLADVERCLHEIREGESYELCLTTRLRSEARPDPLVLHRILRATNPAPFAAFLRFGERAVVCSSPERLLRIESDGRVEARPIKGTMARGSDPGDDERRRERLRGSEKDRAENLMIVDLLRNDLGSVCAVGSVAVPRLMDVETYASVHQMVSTIEGRLAPGRRAIDCVRAAFPGGSMTGAPKRRTMEILERIEGEPRGVYSGAIGYFGLGGGVDLNVVIRTAVVGPEGVTIGAGGAIVALSDPQREFEEMLLKARAVMQAVAIAVHPRFDLGRVEIVGADET